MKKSISLLLAVMLMFSAVLTAPVSAEENEPPESAVQTELPSFSNQTSALRYIRTQMKERVGEIEFRYSGDLFTVDEIVAYANSKADEGDYLRFQIDDLTIDNRTDSMCLHVVYRTDAEQEQAVTDAVGELLQDVNVKALSAYRKALLVFDLVCDTADYADGEADADAYSAYGALVKSDRKVKCQGYALAYYRLAREMGLDCRIVVGEMEQNDGVAVSHAWNAVKIGTKWYYVDATNGDGASRRYAMFMMPPDCGAYTLIPHYQVDAEAQDILFLTADEVAGYAFADTLTGKCGTAVNWELEPLTGLLRITGKGDMTEFPANDLRWRQYSELITDAYISDTVTSVCADCFTGCSLTLHCTENSAAHLYAQENMPEQFHLLTLKEAVSPNCVEPGSETGLKCEICGVVFDGGDTVPVNDDHEDLNEDNECDRCGALLNYQYSGSCGAAVHWYYYSSGELILKGTGETDFAFASNSDPAVTSVSKTKAPWGRYSKTITKITVEEGVTSLCGSVFKDCAKAGTVSIPATVTSIGAEAFRGAKALREAVIPGAVLSVGKNVFYNCTSLERVVLPETVTSIGVSAFGNCTSLSEVIIPGAVTSIGNLAFSGCTALNEVVLPPSLAFLGGQAFANTALTSVVIPRSLTKVGSNGGGPFKDSALNTVEFESGTQKIPAHICDGAAELTKVIFSNEEVSIGSDAFKGCGKLAGVVIPPTVRVIYSKAFANTGITGITIPKSVTRAGITEQSVLATNGIFSGSALKTIVFESGMTKIPSSICRGAASLTDVTIPDTVTEIGEYAFSGCKGFTKFTIPANVAVIHGNAFANSGITDIFIPKTVRRLGTSEVTPLLSYPVFGGGELQTIEFEGGFTKIPDNCCQDAKKLTNVVIPDTVTTIGLDAFSGCESLTEIKLPDELTKIEAYAFAKTALTAVDLPDSVTSVGDSAFAGCQSLWDVGFPAELKTIGSNAFKETALQCVILPDRLTKIGVYAFRNCPSLTSVLISSSEAALSSGVFKDCPENLVIHCPADAKAVTYAAEQSIACHTDYETSEVSLRYCSGEEHVKVVAYCNECGKMVTPDGLLDAMGHTVVSDKGTPAGCTEPGLTAGSHCSVCLTVLEEQREIPAAGHTEAAMEAKEPTCTRNGSRNGVKCSVCGKVLTEPEVIPKTGHSYVTDPAVPPTCTESGLTEGKHCTVCGHRYPSQKTIPAAGHQDTVREGERADGVCDICGERLEENFFQRIIHRFASFFEGLFRWLGNIFKRKGRR